MHIILSHGRGGSPSDAVIRKLCEVCEKYEISYEAINDEDCQNPEVRTERLMAKIEALGPDAEVVLVGFSMGGYCSVLSAEKYRNVRGLFLIAPGLYLPRYQRKAYQKELINIEIVHGWSDDVVLYEHSIRFARETNATLHIMPGTHMLISQLDKISQLFEIYMQRFIV